MSDEAPNIVYGRLLESAHLSGYGFERMTDELEWLLDGDRWQSVGPGHTDVNEFLRSIDLSAFNLGEKKKLHRRIKELQPKATARAIAAASGTPKSTVHRHLSDGVPRGTPKSEPEASDQGKRARPVPPGTPEPAPFERPAKAVAKLNRRDSDKARRSAAATERAQERQAEWDAGANRNGERYDVRLGDFREALADIEPGTVDAIVTDPPYPDEFLPLWSDLAEFAAKVLRPGAPLFAWSGQYRLPEVLARISEHLDYQWTIRLDLPGENARFQATHMTQTWKPIIVAAPGRWGPHAWHPDRVVSPAKDQALYEWQQNPDPAGEIISRYVPDGGLVVDPFAGVGSFGVAAVTLGRRFIGAELNDERHRTALGRIAEVMSGA